MRSKYQRLKFIEKYHLLPVIASIPAITFILYQLLPDFSVLNFDVSHEAALLIFILVIPTIGCLYLVNLFVFFPYLIYMYFSTLKRKLPLSPTFRLINRVFISILLIIFIITADYNRYIFPVQYDTCFFNKFIYGLLLLSIGWGCSVTRFKNKTRIINLIFIFIIYHFLNAFFYGIELHQTIMFLFANISFFAEIFLFKEVLNKNSLWDKTW